MTATATAEQTLLACEVAVLRALELAAKRGGVRGRANGHLCEGPPHEWYLSEAPVPLHKLDKAVDGAWVHLTIALAGDPHAAQLLVACDTYLRELLTKRERHDREALRRYLAVAREG